MPVFKIHHITRYIYDRPVKESVNEIRIFPYSAPVQEVLQNELIITGQPDLHYFYDYWQNKVAVFTLASPHPELVIESRLLVRINSSPDTYLNFNSGKDSLIQEVNQNLQLLELTKADPISFPADIELILQHIVQPWKSVAAIVQDCSQYIFQHFQYIKGITNIETTVDEILQHRAGVCQDFAHVMLQILRSLGVPSRYVSGYICPNKNGMRGEGATHAWVEAWIPGHGWAGIDPTNNVWVTNTHVKLAVGRNFSDCSPVKGTFKGPAKQTLFVHVTVSYEDGHTFQDINTVKLHAIHAAIPEDEIPDSFAGQQQ
jgi:transglutaminase-like putative cysteine protease